MGFIMKKKLLLLTLCFILLTMCKTQKYNKQPINKKQFYKTVQCPGRGNPYP